jgi:imidazolonepropionase
LLTLHGPTGPRRGESMRQLGVIEDGAILISDGIITNVGPSRRIENLAGARSAEEINASGRVVMPGFVDSHTHLIASPPRVPEYRGSGPGESTRGRRAAQFSAEYVRRSSAAALEHQAKKILQGFLRHGTTTAEIKSGYGLDETGELKILRAISHLSKAGINTVSTFMAPHMPPPEFSGSLDQHVDWVRDHLLMKVRQRKTAQFVDAFCDPAGFSLEQTHALLIAARRLGFAIKLHAENTMRMGCVRMGVEMGAVSVDGLNHADATDASVLGQSRTVAVVMPGPIYQGYTSRFAPARQLMDKGAALALASCFHPTLSSTYNMITVIALACTHMGFTPEEAITAATINGAHALTRSTQSGSLEFGKEADLIILGVSDYREIPYQFGVNLVSLTMRRGEIVYREGAVACDAE